MRDVAVTEGDKVEAQIRLGYSVYGYGVGDLAVDLDAPPLSLEAFEVYVESKLDAAFTSQFALVLDEGKGIVPPDCSQPSSATSVQLPDMPVNSIPF